MFFDNINESHCLRLPLKQVTDGRIDTKPTAEQNHSTGPHGFSPFLSVLFFITALLVIRGLYVWIVRYRLQYLLRVSFLVFVCSFGILNGSTFFSTLGWESVPVLWIMCQNSIWNSVTLCSGSTCLVMLLVRYHWGLPLNIIEDSSSVGFSHLEDKAKKRRRTVKELSGEMLRHRDPGQLNPVYVNGWIPLIESKDVVRGRVVSAVAIGYKFCIYRGESDQVFVLDAYCPHMGADLSAGGQVIGNSIECPFHGWQFCGQSGKCELIPYSDKVPDIAKVKVWESREKNGFIFVWHHAEGDNPTWELPSIPEIESGQWVYRGRSELTVHCQIQEIPENGADIAHLSQVHSSFVCNGPGLEGSGPKGHLLQHDWKPPLWEPDETEPHMARVSILQRLVLCGFELPWSRIDVNIEQIGPATVHLHMHSQFGRGVLMQYITSEAPMLQRVVHHFYTEPRWKQLPASFLLWGEAVMFQRDIAVWNNKTFLKNPLLVKEDRLISKFRRWFAQFYSEHSPTLQDLRQRTLEW